MAKTTKKPTQVKVPKMSEKRSYTEGIDFTTEAWKVLVEFQHDPAFIFNTKDLELPAVQEYMAGLEEEVRKIADYRQKYPTFGKEVEHVLGKTAKYAGWGYVEGAGGALAGATAATLFFRGMHPSQNDLEFVYFGSNAVGVVVAIGRGVVGCWNGIKELSEDKKTTDYANLAKTYLASAKKTEV
jgi:hypothetical protein